MNSNQTVSFMSDFRSSIHMGRIRTSRYFGWKTLGQQYHPNNFIFKVMQDCTIPHMTLVSLGEPLLNLVTYCSPDAYWDIDPLCTYSWLWSLYWHISTLYLFVAYDLLITHNLFSSCIMEINVWTCAYVEGPH